jgi:hypothetical protein
VLFRSGGMTLGPILIGSVVIYGIVNFCRHRRGVIGEKLRAARIFHDGHSATFRQ